MKSKLRPTIVAAVLSVVALSSCARQDAGPTAEERRAVAMEEQKAKIAAERVAAQKAAEEKQAAERAVADRIAQEKRDADRKAADEKASDRSNRAEIVQRINQGLVSARRGDGFRGHPREYTYEGIVSWALDAQVINSDAALDLAKRRNTAYVYDEPRGDFYVVEDYQDLLKERAVNQKERDRQAAIDEETRRILATPAAPLPTAPQAASTP